MWEPGMFEGVGLIGALSVKLWLRTAVTGVVEYPKDCT